MGEKERKEALKRELGYAEARGDERQAAEVRKALGARAEKTGAKDGGRSARRKDGGRSARRKGVETADATPPENASAG